MKGKILTSLLVIGFCSSAYGVDYMVTGPTGLDSVPNTPGLNVIINDGGDYSLLKLDAISQYAGNINIDFTTGAHSNPMAVLVADLGFDGNLSNLFVSEPNTQIRLTGDFLSAVSGDEILHFDNLTMLGNINVTEEVDSGMYAYDWVTCSGGVGRCVRRRYSDSYLAQQQSTQHAIRVANSSVQNNPGKLLMPMTAINRHELLDVFNFSDDNFLDISPEYYIAKDFQNAGIRMKSGTKFGGRLSIGAGAYVYTSEFKNSVSGFDSVVYGGNLRFLYDIDDVMFLRGLGGFSFSNIKCDNVVRGNSVVNNPNAYGFYGGMDFGATFKFESGLYLSPFIGYQGLSQTVVDIHENNSVAHVGGDVGFDYFMDGVKYSYILRAGVNTDGFLDASVGIGAWTVSDKIGGNVSIGVIDTDFGFSGKVSANVRFGF